MSGWECWEGGITKQQGETLQGDGDVHNLNCGDGFTDVYTRDTYNVVYFRSVQLIMPVVL